MNFLERYERRVFRTIKRAKLVEENDKIYVGLSGGKDSVSSLVMLKRFAETYGINCEIKGFHLDFGIPHWQKVVEVVKKQAESIGFEVEIIDLKELGIPIQEIVKKSVRPPCSTCGVIKRYLMNKLPRERGANKLATGHHMDDFLVFFFKNLIGKNFLWISKFKPKVEPSHPKFLCRIRPLFEVGRKDNEKFCKLMNIPFLQEEICAYSLTKCKLDLKKRKWFKTIDEIEKRHRNFKIQTIKAIEEMSEFFKSEEKLRECSVCGEPTNKEVCAFCNLIGKN